MLANRRRSHGDPSFLRCSLRGTLAVTLDLVNWIFRVSDTLPLRSQSITLSNVASLVAILSIRIANATWG
ncbi:hypothetical protein BHE74_00030584 [Ensete ventricosum]|nr:hypothetical protein GW17_00016480 [Ensete ventricosum]RWW62298.1 hypothetical protein BHE74_00030584 [Ensete ventricosum]